MKSRVTTIYLVVSGLMLLAIGAAILLVPHTFHSSNGITLGNDPNLLSEIRAPGGLLVGTAVLILMGVFRSSARSFAVLLSVLVYGSFGVGRLVGMALDGMPSEGIVGATVIELVVAVVGGLLVKYQHQPAARPPSNAMEVAANM